MISDQSGARLIFKDGTEQKLGVILPGKLGEVYSLIRNEKGVFIFDSEQVDPGFMGRLAGLMPLLGMDNPRRGSPNI